MVRGDPDGDVAVRRRAVTQAKPLSALAVSDTVHSAAHADELTRIVPDHGGVDREITWRDDARSRRHDPDVRGK